MRRFFFILASAIACAVPPTMVNAEGAFVIGDYRGGGILAVINYNFAASADAQSAALQTCRTYPDTTHCRVMATFRASCYAYSFAAGGGYGSGSGPDLNSAQSSALTTCRKYNPGAHCYVRDSGCDTLHAEEEARRAENQNRTSEHTTKITQSVDERAALEQEEREQEKQREAEQARQQAELEQERAALQRAREQAEVAVRQRQEAERRLAELLTYTTQRDTCRRFDSAACETALRSPHANAQDAADFKIRIGVAAKFHGDLEACMTGSRAACDAALLFPALTDEHRPQINEWRSAASPLNRALAYVAAYGGIAATTVSNGSAAVLDLPTSTHIASGIAAVLALTLATLAVRNRRVPAVAPTDPKTIPQSAAEAEALPSDTATAEPATPPGDPIPTPPTQAVPQPTLPMVRDTPAAIAALELAHAYIEEIREADSPGLEEEDDRKQHLNTLALASKQLDAAEKHDPDARLDGLDDKDNPYRYSINELKAEALLLEGITHQSYDLKRAVPALRKATELNPTNARAFYALGLTHAANMNRAEAVTAFESAVALNPKNLAYRKELDRAQSLTAGTIAAYKATRAGERIFDAGIRTANAGVFVYNVGVVAWNIFAFTWNIVTFPLRMVGAMFRLLRLM